MANSSGAERCPVCKDHTVADNLQAQGVVLTGIMALVNGDLPTVTNVYESLTPYDGHTAIGMCANLLAALAEVGDVTIEELIASYREALNEAQAEQ